MLVCREGSYDLLCSLELPDCHFDQHHSWPGILFGPKLCGGFHSELYFVDPCWLLADIMEVLKSFLVKGEPQPRTPEGSTSMKDYESYGCQL